MPTEDLYPSRVGATPKIMERLDPIVYSEWTEDAPVSRRQLEQYRENGYLILRGVFSAAEVAALQQEAGELQSGRVALEEETLITEPRSGAVRSIFRLHDQSGVFDRMAKDCRLAGVAQFLLNDDVYLHQTRLNYKPGFEGKDFYWHSDFETWHVEDGMPRMRALSMSVLLTENTPANSPTMFMNGSHRKYVSCIGETPEDHYKKSLKKQEFGVPDQDILTEFAKRGVAAPCGAPGDVVIFDCNTMHGSNSNITPLPRSNAFIVYNAMSNRMTEPFGPKRPRPDFIAARKCERAVKPVEGALIARAA